MQFGADKTLGVVYVTTMDRPDAALALALLHGYEGKREARIAALSVVGSGLGAAAFCDVVARFYAGQGPLPNSNRLLPVGLLAESGPDSPMVTAVLEKKNDKGEPVYPRGVRSISDTSEVRAQIRNALTGLNNGTVVMVLSAPPTMLERVLELPGTRELITAKVRTLVISSAGGVPVLETLVKDWPTPVVVMDKSIGDTALYPGASVESDFAWTPNHPVADAYRAFRPGPYDAPTWDLAAMQYATHPDSTIWSLSEPGGQYRVVTLAEGQAPALVKALTEVASAKPVPRPARFRPPAQQEKKATEPVKK